MFSTYLYASSASVPMVAHFEALADDIAARVTAKGALATEIGSNDGILLRPMQRRGFQVLGIEPAANLALVANSAGLETWNDFFSSAVAERIRNERGPARVIVANNVLAHIDQLDDVVRAVEHLLDDEGIFVAEFPYLLDLFQHVEYDTIYHEHLSYFHLAPLARLFGGVGMEIFDAIHLDIHGGSLRIFVGHGGHRPRTERVTALRRAESELTWPSAYNLFARRVKRSRDALLAMLRRLHQDGRTVAALGATAKGNTLLNYCGIGQGSIAFVADSTPMKQGLLTPGTHIPVRSEEALYEEQPDYAVLLAWNYADAIMQRHADYLEAGGRFIHPIPTAHVLQR